MINYKKILSYIGQSLLLAFAFAPLMGLTQAPEKITITSYTPQDYADILSGR
jgi:hypothetical protein